MRSAAASNLAAAEEPLYAEHRRVYPKAVHGPVRRLKWAVLSLCLVVYYMVPWLRWARGPGRPDQAILIDLPGRRAFFFNIEIWPQEVYYLAGLLILGAIALFFVTSLFGRLWCGFACPQTVWTDLYLWTERLIEGDRGDRLRLDAMPWSARKLAKKATKHALWLVIALLTGGAWVMYFYDAPSLARELFAGRLSTGPLFFIGLFTATTYVLAGWAREQVCTFMCPWPRFQSAMVDRYTLTVMYGDWRGEPRAPHKKGDPWRGRGDCIDCSACVAACPTGIDIRDGLQLQCIGCGLCIDACNDIMDRVGRPRGLIAFSSDAMREAARAHIALAATVTAALVRPRSTVYAAVLVGGAALLLWSLLARQDFQVDVLADRAPLYVRLADGGIRNAYTVKILNKRPQTRHFRLSTRGLAGARLAIAGPGERAAGAPDLAVGPDSVGTFRVLVALPPGAVHHEAHFAFVVSPAADSPPVPHEVEFHAPDD